MAALASLLLLASAASYARADGGICMHAFVGASGDAEYGSNTGCSGGFGVGLTFSNTDGNATLTTNPDPMNPGLTTGSFEVQSSTTGETGTASCGASLQRGELSAFVDGPPNRSSVNDFLFDNLHFTTTDGAPSAPVTVKVHLRGSQVGTGSFGNAFSFALGGSFSYFTRTSPPGFGFSQGPSNFTSFDVKNLTDSSLDFTGVVTVMNGSTQQVQLDLVLDCSNSEICDYTNGVTVNLQLPSNLQVTSESGVFLSQTFGGDDAGFLPPLKSKLLKCENAVAKGIGKLVQSIGKCHASRIVGTKVTDDTSEDACEQAAIATFEKTKTLDCGACTDLANIVAGVESTVDTDNADIYCATGTSFGGDDTGNLPADAPKGPIARCEMRVGKAAATLAASIVKCHIARANGRTTEDLGEDACEQTAITHFTSKTNTTGCDPCTDLSSIATSVESRVDQSNGFAYCQ